MDLIQSSSADRTSSAHNSRPLSFLEFLINGRTQAVTHAIAIDVYYLVYANFRHLCTADQSVCSRCRILDDFLPSIFVIRLAIVLPLFLAQKFGAVPMVFVLPGSVVGFVRSLIPLIASVFHFLKLNPPRCISDLDLQHSYIHTYIQFLYLNTIRFKAHGLWGRVKIITVYKTILKQG